MVCDQHSGIEARVKQLEGDVKALWLKWDNVQKLLIGTLVILVVNLTGVIFLIVR